MNRADISRAGGVVASNLSNDNAAKVAFVRAAVLWRTLSDVPTEWRDKIVQAHAELAQIENEKDELDNGMDQADISRAAGVVARFTDLDEQSRFVLASLDWRTLDDVQPEWRDQIVQAHALLDRLEKESLDDFTTVAMLNSMGAAITMGATKADFGKPLTPLQSEDWDELELGIGAMLDAGFTPEFPDDWGDSLQVPSPSPTG